MRLGDNVRTARLFIERLKAEFQVRALMTGDSGMTPEILKTHVRHVVDVFLNGVGHDVADGGA